MPRLTEAAEQSGPGPQQAGPGKSISSGTKMRPFLEEAWASSNPAPQRTGRLFPLYSTAGSAIDSFPPAVLHAFGDALWPTIPDPAHSQVEDRWIVLGQSHQRRLLVVVHTERGDSIRIISARRASRGERKTYEESN